MKDSLISGFRYMLNSMGIKMKPCRVSKAKGMTHDCPAPHSRICQYEKVAAIIKQRSLVLPWLTASTKHRYGGKM